MIKLFKADAFTARPFHGNPAAICLADAPLPDAWMQSFAAEMNLSETAFLWPEGDGTLRLRWFTPKIEVDLCGHATLASAHVLWESGALPAGEAARFTTRSGLLIAEKRGPWITLDFPTIVPRPGEAPPLLLEALGVIPTRVRGFATSPHSAIVELAAESDVRAVRPHFAQLAGCPVRAVSVTAVGDPRSDHDIVSRFFAPKLGLNEDPVTGSAYSSLSVYWADKLGKPELVAFQASQRGGTLKLALQGERVKIAGEAVTVAKGEAVGPA